jgi:hypothetical protein
MRGLVFVTMATIIGVPALFFVGYGRYGGMPWDFQLVWVSESNPGPWGALYVYDTLRLYTNLFYHVGYHISRLAGVDGDWIGLHAIYALLWTAKGLLVYWLCRVLDLNVVIASLSAVFAILHGSDTSIGHVGQLNQYGVAYWSLLSMCLFAIFVRDKLLLALVGSVATTHLALWSHEAALFGIWIAPALICTLMRRWVGRREIVGAVIAMLTPALYASLMFERLLLHPSGQSYQESVVRSDLSSFGTVFGDFTNLVSGAFLPPLWLATNQQAWFRFLENPTSLVPTCAAIGLIGLFAAAVGLAVTRVPHDDFRDSTHLAAAAAVFLLLSLAFVLPFLALPAGGGFWRTQILAAPFASIAVAAVSWLVIRPLAARVRAAIILCLVVFYGSLGFVATSASYDRWNREWEPFRAPIERLLQAVPSVKAGTIILLQGVPPGVLWESNYWFDMIVRLAYPQVLVAGSYTLAAADVQIGANDTSIERISLGDEKHLYKPAGSLFIVEGGHVASIPVNGPDGPSIIRGRLDQVVAIRWTNVGPMQVIDRAGDIEAATTVDAEQYRPRERILGSISPVARRRFSR